MIRSMSYLFFYTYFIFWLFVVDLEESQFCFWPWHFRLFSLLFKSSHHLGQCSASSCSSVVWDKSLTMFLLLCSVKAYFWFFGYCNNVSSITSKLLLAFSVCAGTEIFTGNVRVLFSSMGVCLAFAFGFMMLPLFAYFLRDWTYLLLGISLPGLLYFPLWW